MADELSKQNIAPVPLRSLLMIPTVSVPLAAARSSNPAVIQQGSGMTNPPFTATSLSVQDSPTPSLRSKRAEDQAVEGIRSTLRSNRQSTSSRQHSLSRSERRLLKTQLSAPTVSLQRSSGHSFSSDMSATSPDEITDGEWDFICTDPEDGEVSDE
ncbi:hypothetical protein IAU59_007601 [Kwoniella sp. CBS 9459]